MLNLSFEETIENHRKMWNWIADETLKQKKVIKKEDYFEAHNISSEQRPYYLCYACDFSDNGCGLCPLSWGNDDNRCGHRGSPYHAWRGIIFFKQNNYELAAKYAKEIANLPINEAYKNN